MNFTCRPRKKKDDAVLIQITLQTMKKIHEESTGRHLTETMIQQQIEEHETTMVIENRGQILGYYCFTPLPTGQMYLGALILSPKAQHKGIGKRALSKMEHAALAKGIHTLLVHVHYTNSNSLVFCLKNGFKILGSHMQGMLALEKRLP